jgi:hypothetical protein
VSIIYEHIMLINLINVMYMYVVKDIVRIVTYRDTLEYILVITFLSGVSPVCILVTVCVCK